MVNYLAVDFGTSNCLAGHLVLIDGIYKLKLIELEEGRDVLPSLIFVRQVDLPPCELDAERLETTIQELLKKEKERVEAAYKEVDERVKAYFHREAPRVKKPDPADYFKNSVGWRRALQRYEADLKSLPAAIERFKNGPLQEHKADLLNRIRPVRSEEEIRSQARTRMVQEEFEKRSQALWEKTFFSALNDDSMETLYGSEALAAYVADPLSGFFLRSPKAFLGTALHEQHKELFTKVISQMLRRIRIRAEQITGIEFGGVVMGRPVNFHGTNDEGSNERAVEILKKASQRAGFPEVRFVYEPLAAALALRRKLIETDDPIVICDVGGGTTDVAYLDVTRNKKSDFLIRGVGGERVGGNDFDSSIARGAFAYMLGKDALLKSGRRVPSKILNCALNTSSLPDQVFFRRSGVDIEQFMVEVVAEDRDRFFRLRDMYIRQLQHRVLLTAETVKQEVGEVAALDVALDFFQSPFTASYSAGRLVEDCELELLRIKSIVAALLADFGQPEVPVRAFLTGGMSLQPALVSAIRSCLPERSMVEFMPPIRSVVGGLAIVAQELNSVLAGNQEPDFVRGVQVMSV